MSRWATKKDGMIQISAHTGTSGRHYVVLEASESWYHEVDAGYMTQRTENALNLGSWTQEIS